MSVVKAAPTDLAILGGPPSFREPLHVGRPNIGDRASILRSIANALDDRWLSNGGARVEAFEARLSERFNGLHCVATCNGTLALQIVLRALGVTGDVVLPALTFVATAHAVEWERLRPVFADVEPETLCMGHEQAATLIGPTTGALLGVHLWGRSSDPQALERLASAHRLPLIFDAAHALGCSRDGRELATYGDASIVSFHATKIANAFEGGVIVTRDEGLAERARQMRNFGFVDEDQVAGLGINAKLSEAGGAMGLASLDALDDLLAASRGNYQAYASALDGVDGIRLLPFEPASASNCHHIVVEVDGDVFGLCRDDLRATLVAENVLARRYFFPGCHRVPPYSARNHAALPVTEEALRRCLSLPTGTAVTPADIDVIGQIIRLAAAGASTISGRTGG